MDWAGVFTETCQKLRFPVDNFLLGRGVDILPEFSQ
jgi:hypothetical protein